MATAATVKGTFLNPDGTARASAVVVFNTLSTPFTESTEIIASKVTSYTLDSNGKLNGNSGISLVQGFYMVIVDNTDRFIINVPSDGGTYEIPNILVKTLSAYTGSKNVVTASDITGKTQESTTIATSRGGDRNKTRNRFCVIGNFGDGSSDAEAVSTAVLAMEPEHIITTGNNNYPDGDAGDIDANVGQWYADYIGNYSGAYGAGAVSNLFWPSPGYVDWGAEIGGSATLASYLSYFTLPTNGNSERYYRQVLSDYVEIFVLDSSQNEPDGYVQGSTQGAWLQAALAASTKRWKIVVFADGVKASVDAFAGNAYMEWPFATWGAHAVLMGGPLIYERLTIDGIPYFMVGNGGKGLDTIGTPVAESQIRVAKYGTLVIDANEYSLQTFMVDKDGEVFDEYELVNNTQNAIINDVKLAPDGGLGAGANGLYRIETGSDKEPTHPNKHTTEFGMVIHSQTTPDVVANPFYRKCIWMKGYDNPIELYVYNWHEKAWKLYNTPATTSAYDGGYTQLAVPTVTPSSGNAKSFVLSHGTSGVTLYYSINGAAFSVYSAPVFFNSAHGKNPTVLAYADKAGYRVSDYVTAQFALY